MDKKERLSVLTKLKPQTWHTFCMIEAMYGKEIETSKVKLATQLNISLPTLSKYLAIWKSLGLILDIPGGFAIAQLDGTPSSITGEVKERSYKTSRDLIAIWCDVYVEEYGEAYNVSNWGMAQKQVEKLLAYSDEEIEAGIATAIKLYATKWVNPRYPRPTLGALCSWLFQQALPYAEVEKKSNVSLDALCTTNMKNEENLLDDLEAKGWI